MKAPEWSDEKLREMAEAEDAAGCINIGSFDSVMERLAQEAEARRQFIATLSPGVREYAVRCFAQLGLHQ